MDDRIADCESWFHDWVMLWKPLIVCRRCGLMERYAVVSHG